MITVYPTTPSIVGMRDTLLLMVSVTEDTDEKLLHFLTRVCIYDNIVRESCQ
jgi:hypothetical protein